MRIGTAGYSYTDWRGAFYPADMKESDFLRFYSERFSCVEIDSTYYRVTGPSMFEAISKKVPEGFMFTIKVPSTFTHEREKFERDLIPFRRGIKPIAMRPRSPDHAAHSLWIVNDIIRYLSISNWPYLTRKKGFDLTNRWGQE